MEFGSSSERDDVLDTFTDEATKIFIAAGLAALKDAGFKATKDRYADDINVKKNHGRNQNWIHQLSIDISSYRL